MKILFCNNTMAMLAGSELVTYNLARAMQKKGHDVAIYSRNIGGLLEEKLKKAKIPYERDVKKLKKPDVIHAHHHDPTAQVVGQFPDVPVVFTLHGIIGGPETPPENLKQKENVIYVAVSEEVQALLKHVHKKESEIIRQGIDLKRYKLKKPLNKRIKKALISTSYLDHDHPFIHTFRKACNIMAIEPVAIGRAFNWTWETEDAYNDTDIVFAIGRGVLEAMACGRPAVTYGHWGHSGILTKEEMEDAKKYNFSGRHVRDEYFGWKEIMKTLSQYDPKKDYRALVKDYSLDKKVEQYEVLYNKLVDAK